MRDGERYITTYRLSLKPTGSNSIYRSVVKNADGVSITQPENPHSNIHSCLDNVGFCSPFVSNCKLIIILIIVLIYKFFI